MLTNERIAEFDDRKNLKMNTSIVQSLMKEKSIIKFPKVHIAKFARMAYVLGSVLFSDS